MGCGDSKMKERKAAKAEGAQLNASTKDRAAAEEGKSTDVVEEQPHVGAGWDADPNQEDGVAASKHSGDLQVPVPERSHRSSAKTPSDKSSGSSSSRSVSVQMRSTGSAVDEEPGATASIRAQKSHKHGRSSRKSSHQSRGHSSPPGSVQQSHGASRRRRSTAASNTPAEDVAVTGVGHNRSAVNNASTSAAVAAGAFSVNASSQRGDRRVSALPAGSVKSADLRSEFTSPQMRTAVYPEQVNTSALPDRSSILPDRFEERSTNTVGRISVTGTGQVPVDSSNRRTPQPNDIPEDLYVGLGPESGDGYLPPYEWAPRTMPLSSSPMRYEEMTASERRTYRPPASGGTPLRGVDYVAEPERSYVAQSYYRNSPPPPPLPQPSFQRPQYAQQQQSYAGEWGNAAPMPSHTFYPQMPPVQPQSSPRRSNSPGAPYTPPRSVSPYQSASRTAYQYDGALRSPIEDSRVYMLPPQPAVQYVVYPRPSPTRASRHVDPAYMEKYAPEQVYEESAYRQPSMSRGGYPPMTAQAAPQVVPAEGDLYPYLTENRSPYRGVSAHQYKPVTYMFDNAVDQWAVPGRPVTSPQRELYSDADDTW